MASLYGLEPEQLARIGIFYLEEAVLDVLHGAKHNEEWLMTVEIYRQVDISRSSRNSYLPILAGILDKLEGEGRIERDSKRKQRWQLTEEEFRRRRLENAVMIYRPQGGESPRLPCGETSRDGEMKGD